MQFSPKQPIQMIDRPIRPALTLMDTLTSLGLTTNLRLCLDAGDAASYTSGTKWLDRAGSGYDFFRGATNSAEASDPTFNGTAGARSVNEYWSFDGGDYFTYDTTNETWMQNIHKNNAVFTIVGWAYIGAASTVQRFCGTRAGNNSNIGFSFWVDASNKINFAASNGSGTAALQLTMAASISAGSWQFVAVTLNEATGASGASIVLNSTVETFTSTYTSPSASNATYTMEIAAGGLAGAPLTSGSRMAALAAWEGVALTTTNIGAIYNATRKRFGV